jgi:ATP-binding cassette subfamily B protein
MTISMLPALTQQLHSWRGRVRALRNLPPILKLVWSSGPLLTSVGVVLRLIAALVPVASLWVGKLIIDRIVASIRNPGVIPGDIWILLTCELLLVVAGNVFGRAIDYCDVRLTDEFTREVSLRIMRHASKLDLQSFEDPSFYDRLDRARAQATDRLGMLNGIGRLLQQSITLVSLAAGVIVYSPPLFLLLVLCVIPAFLGESHFAFVGYTLAHLLTPVRRELDYLRVLGTSKESAKEVKVFGLGDHLRNRFDQLTGTIIEENKSLSRRRLLWGSLLGMLGSIGYYAAYAFLVFRAIKGQMSVGDLTFLGGSLLGCANQISMLFSTFASIADQALFLTDLLEFFAVKPRISSRANALPAPRPMRSGYEFRNVCFSYPGSSRLILNNINFRIEAGERIALVGENGQGKTTLVKLLARLYDPTSGVILLDGVDLRDYDVDDLHREIGVIFQDFMRYDLPARENIGVGRIDQVYDDVGLLEAARKSGADEVLAKLPGGLDQILGRRFEGGVDLSGGEWQKFALARAYLRDSQVLILDEPTSSLDAAAEYEVFERFAELTRARTALFISHRLSTVRMADRIVVIDGGNVGEQGTHQELIDRGGQYARLFEMQASSYR